MATIKKGSYRFNDDLTYYGNTQGVSIAIPFTVTPSYSVDPNTYSIIYSETPSAFTSFLFASFPDGLPEFRLEFIDDVNGNNAYVYTNESKWDETYESAASTGLLSNIEGLKGWGQTITITEDTDVDDTFGTWFVANTETVAEGNVIKAGTYEFNLDTLTVPTFTKDVVIPFTDFANDTFSGMKFETTEASVFTLTYYTDTAEELAYTNDASSGWVGWQSTKYQTITIAKDTTVDADFYSWFNANITASGGGDTPDKPTTPTKKFTRLYLGDVAYSSGGKCFKRLTTEQPQEESGNYLTFSSPSAFTLATANSTKNWDGTLEYSTDANTWHTWDGTTTLSADSGKLYVRGTGNTYIMGTDGDASTSNLRWVLTGSDISCFGNIENLLDYAKVANGEHPTMADNCYSKMFFNCTSLTSAPELPATTLAERCYSRMFDDCASLINAPALPATTLAYSCYSSMFRYCVSLTSIPALPATTLAERCYYQMFYGCQKIALYTSKSDEHQTEYRVPTSGTGTTASGALTDIVYLAGGQISALSINTTYYTSNTVV